MYGKNIATALEHINTRIQIEFLRPQRQFDGPTFRRARVKGKLRRRISARYKPAVEICCKAIFIFLLQDKSVKPL